MYYDANLIRHYIHKTLMEERSKTRIEVCTLRGIGCNFSCCRGDICNCYKFCLKKEKKRKQTNTLEGTCVAPLISLNVKKKKDTSMVLKVKLIMHL